MVKCVRLQLIGYETKSGRIDFQDVLKYINNPGNPGGSISKALNPMKMLSIDSNSGSSSNNKNNSSDSSSSKYDNINILVDYDIILWGKMHQSSSSSNDNNSLSRGESSKNRTSFFSKGKSSSKDDYDSRKDMINHKFMASRLANEPLELPFSFKLRHITDTDSISLPSSYKNGKCQIEYFLYATIHRPWPNRNSVRLLKLRVLQKIKVDIPKYMESMEDKKIKELKFMKYIKKGLIEMNVKIPKKAYTHRENIPIEITLNHLGMNKTIIGFVVGLYERCFYLDNNTKKYNKYSFKLVSERFYEYQVKPGESNAFTILNFPLIDGNCSIQRKFLRSSMYSTNSNTNSNINSNTNTNMLNSSHIDSGNDENIKTEQEGNIEDEDLVEDTENEDITRILLKDAKIPPISPTIDDSKWSIKVNHCIRVVAITNEYIDKIIHKFKSSDDKINNEESSQNDKEKDESPNNKYEEYLETDSICIHVSPPASPVTPNANINSVITQNNGYLSANMPESRRTSYTGTKELLNTQNLENKKFITENKKYGSILGHLSNGDTPTLPKSQKSLDTVFDITIGTMTKTPRIYGKEFKLDEEIEDQYYNAILRKNNINSKLKLVSSNGSINKNSEKKDDEPDIHIHARIRTNSSSTDSLILETESSLNEDPNLRQRLSPVPINQSTLNANVNKELPHLPKQASKDEKKKGDNVSQNPPLPPRNDGSTSLPPFQQSLPLYGQEGQQQYPLFPNFPQCSNPQEYQPSAPTMEDIDNPPPPYEYNANSNNQHYF